MKILSSLVLLTLILQFSSNAYALSDCSKAENDSEVLACSSANRKEAEMNLNQEYENAKKRIADVFSQDVTERKNYMDIFTKAQRSWLKFRQYQCEMESHPAEKGTNLNLDYTNTCIVKLDVERTNALKEIPYD